MDREAVQLYHLYEARLGVGDSKAVLNDLSVADREQFTPFSRNFLASGIGFGS